MHEKIPFSPHQEKNSKKPSPLSEETQPLIKIPDSQTHADSNIITDEYSTVSSIDSSPTISDEVDAAFHEITKSEPNLDELFAQTEPFVEKELERQQQIANAEQLDAHIRKNITQPITPNPEPQKVEQTPLLKNPEYVAAREQYQYESKKAEILKNLAKIELHKAKKIRALFPEDHHETEMAERKARTAQKRAEEAAETAMQAKKRVDYFALSQEVRTAEREALKKDLSPILKEE